jgi:putative hemolysin
MSTFSAEVLLILILIAINGALAMSEIALVSANKARLRQRAGRGDVGAEVALRLADSPTRFLSAIQIGITLIGILAGAFGGARIAVYLEPRLAGLPVVGAYADGLALAIVVVIITYLSVVFGEIVPKRSGLTHPESISRIVARPVLLLAQITRPLVWLLSVSTDAVLFVLRIRPTEASRVTDVDIRLLLEQGTREGVLAEEERAMAQRALALGDRRVSTSTPDRGSPDYARTSRGVRSPIAAHLSARMSQESRLLLGSYRPEMYPVSDGRQPDLLTALPGATFVPENVAFSIMKCSVGRGLACGSA